MSQMVNQMSQSVGQSVGQAVASPYFPFLVALVIGMIVYNILFAKSHFPCFCDKCEEKLINQAAAGDPTAQAKLQNAIHQDMYNNKVPDYLSGLGPLAWIALLAMIMGAVYFANFLGKQATSRMPQSFTSIPQSLM